MFSETSWVLLLFSLLPLTCADNVTAVLGEDVTLHCKAPKNSSVLVVEWNRPDLNSPYVLIYRDERFYPEYQNPAFRNRVELQDLQKGDVSLILSNVVTDDAGTYQCYVLQSETNRRQRRMEPTSIISLRVVPEKEDPAGNDGEDRDQGGMKDGLTAGLVVGIVVGVAGVLVVVLVIYRRCLMKDQDHRELASN